MLKKDEKAKPKRRRRNEDEEAWNLPNNSIRVEPKKKKKIKIDAIDDDEDVYVPEPLMEPSEHSLRQLLNALKATAQRVDLPAAETALAGAEAHRLTKLIEKQTELLNLLDRELAALSRVANKRITFYRALQRLSDDVALPTDIVDVDVAMAECLSNEEAWKQQIQTEDGKLRYLDNLATTAKEGADDNAGGDTAEQICQICQTSLSESAQVLVTVCGVRPSCRPALTLL
jgi:hypothetical protein